MARTPFGEFAVVIPTGVVRIFNAIDNAAKIGEPDRRSIAIRDDQFLVIGCFEELPAGLQRYGSLRPPEHAGRNIDVAVVERAIDFVDTDLTRSQFVRIQLDVDGIFCRSHTCT